MIIARLHGGRITSRHASAKDLAKAMRLGLGQPIRSFGVMDPVGLGVVLKARALYRKFAYVKMVFSDLSSDAPFLPCGA